MSEKKLKDRRRRWNKALEDWLRERGERYSASTFKHSRLAWRRVKNWQEETQQHRELWELTPDDFEVFAGWMEEKGYSPNTTYLSMGILANFYRWCDERRIDAECEVGFNPAAEARRPVVRRYERAKMLSDEEAEALLDLYRRDKTLVGKRDYAFMLARLRTGVRLEALRRLRYRTHRTRSVSLADFHNEYSVPAAKTAEDSVEWQARLPEDVWEAIVGYLEAAGRGSTARAVERAEGTREMEYVFAPLAEPGVGAVKGVAEEWLEERAVSASQLLASLKLYGRRVGIPEERLTLMGLRNTAIRQRMEAGASVEEMRAFMDSRSADKLVKYRLKKLPEAPLQVGSFEQDSKLQEVEPPERMPKPFKPGEGYYHGLYAGSQPMEEVAAVLKEDIQGMEEEIVGMRVLGRGLLERQARAKSSQEGVRLGDAYTKTAARLAEMMRVEKQMAKEEAGKDDTEALLERWDKMAIGMVGEPISEQIRAEALGESPEMAVAARRLVEEIASIRYVLRNTFQLAMGEEDDGEYRHLVEIYSAGCARLVRLLRMEGDKDDRVKAYIDESFESALKEVMEELGIGGSG